MRFELRNANRLFEEPSIENAVSKLPGLQATTPADVDAQLLDGLKLYAWGDRPWPMIISSPERAILEFLNELPDKQSFEHAADLFSGLANLSPRRLQGLLKKCNSVKVTRLFLWFAERYDHAWLKRMDVAAIFVHPTQIVLGTVILLFGSKSEPLHRSLIVLRNTSSVFVHPTQTGLGLVMPLFGSKSEPLHRSLIVLRNTSSVFVHPTQTGLGLVMPLFGSKFVPLHRSFIILWNTLSIWRTSQPRLVWALVIPLFGRKSVPLHRSLIVLWNTFSVPVHHTQIVLGSGKSPVRQKVCTTSPQSYNPVEHLVRLAYIHTQIGLGTGHDPCSAASLSTTSPQSYNPVEHLFRSSYILPKKGLGIRVMPLFGSRV